MIMVAYITQVDETNYDEIINNNSLILLDIYAEWCGPCKAISPIIDDISVEYQGKVTVCKMDADKCTNKVVDLGVRNIPTIIILKNGVEVDRVKGLTSKRNLKEIIEKQL